MRHADWLPQPADVTVAVATGTQDTPATAAAAATVRVSKQVVETEKEGERETAGTDLNMLRRQRLQPRLEVRCCCSVLQVKYHDKTYSIFI